MLNTEKILKRCDLAFNTSFLNDYMTHINFTDFNELISYLNNDDNNYIYDSVHECADSSVDIYYYNLRQWAVENYSYIEDAINELGAPEPFDFHKAIQYGQYQFYTEQINEDIQNFKEWIEENYTF